MNRILTILLCLFTVTLFFSSSLSAQRAAELTPEELPSWRRITDARISNDGKWVVARIAPFEGDTEIQLYDQKGNKELSLSPTGNYAFSASSDYLVVALTTSKQVTDSLKLAKTKRDNMPMDQLLLYRLAGGEERIDSVRSFRVAEEANWMAYQRNRKDSTLHIRSMDGSKTYAFPSVSEYRFARKSGMIWFLSGGDTLGMQSGLYALDPTAGEPSLVKAGKEYYKQITWDEKGERLAFLHCEKKDSAYKAMDLWYWQPGADSRRVATRGDAAFPTDWVISENGSLSFSENGRRLFFGTSPEPRQKDSTRLADNFPNVQVWSWDEPVQYTVQSYNRASDLKKSYRAVYDVQNGKLFQLADESLPDFTFGNRGNSDIALLNTSRPYSLSSMWESATRRDIWSVSLSTGERKLLKEADYSMLRLSPAGKYAFWYSRRDSTWHTLDLITLQEVQLTSPATFIAWDEENDTPSDPNSYGSPGWTEDDRYLLLYDRYDIWRFDPAGKEAPVNLTVNGRTEKKQYRLHQFDPEARFYSLSDNQFIRGFNETTKGYGFYETTLSRPAVPKTLLEGDFMLTVPVKAKNSNDIIYRRETFEQYPEVRLSDLTLKKTIQLTNEGAQAEGIKWGTAELVSWVSLDGKRLEGMLFKPAGFDPNKKYPLLVNFYERYSETLHSYRIPSPHRSTIDYHLYLSHDYVIFNPDIVYEDGYPGESCYNCVMPGISMLIDQGFVDEKAIGAQGHSWGGYQVAYLATRTNLFAAIESGAPVVNMFSAYGGIRWGSGMARAFQYEHTQSRIGGTPWTHFREFVENSPLFTMDKVTTPILIMHNDNDGHVPWYQGIEYFVALKRLGKPAWMLNYTGEVHWPDKISNRVDFQKRMFQFFNHYLKKEPMPVWMKDGVPAVDQDFELGYEFAE